MPQGRKKLAGSLLDEVYEEAKEITAHALSNMPGRPTLGIDGHKVNRRHVETLTTAKLGISAFTHVEYMGTTRTTGENLAKLALKHMTSNFIAVVADNTSNNTGQLTGLFAEIKRSMPNLICLGCYVHVLDLLVEDLAKLEDIKSAGDDAHFMVSFVKKHGLLYEEFRQKHQGRGGVAADLVHFPQTRFAYLYLMCKRVALNYTALRLLSESALFEATRAQLSRRGRDQGEKAREEFQRFEDLVTSRASKAKIIGATAVLEPFSSALHYSEGDSVPLSHVYVIFQSLYDLSQQLDEYPAIQKLLPTDDQRSEVTAVVRGRWLGEGQKKGLKHDAQLCAFALDPYVQASLATRDKPECDLLTNEVTDAARRVLKQVAGSDAGKRAMLSQQFNLWLAAYPRKDAEGAQVHRSGQNAFSSLYLVAMDLVWDLIDEREKAMAADTTTVRTSVEADATADIKELIAKLKLMPKPTDFWLSMLSSTPTGATPAQIEAHRYFCKAACDISAIVGHTCGVERAGKGYGLVLTPLRKRMATDRVKKAVYVLENYGLSRLKMEAGTVGLTSFLEGLLEEGDEADADAIERMASRVHQLRRGNLIVDDAGEQVAEDDGGDGQDEDDVTDDDVEADAWQVPEGFTVAAKPSVIDSTCVGKMVYMNWNVYGWQLGVVKEMITSATPRLFRKFNVRITWNDTSGPAMLSLDEYEGGAEAALDKWVFLEKVVESV